MATGGAAGAAAAKKAVATTLKLIVHAGQAKPAPPVGPALGQAGVNIMAFCKEFNARTQAMRDDRPLRVQVRVFADKSYEWSLKGPPTSWLIKKSAGLARGSDRPGPAGAAVGTISLKHLYHIAESKQGDMPGLSLRGVVKCLMHQCRSMGVKVVARPEDG
jgi:large subunit ribosomal protein L11